MDTRVPRNRNEKTIHNWKEPENVKCPECYSDDFTSDNGYFTEENGTKQFKIENGTMTAKADSEGALSYLHIYEKNVCMKVRFKYSEPGERNAYISFVLRYNSPHAYIRLSYYNKSRVWTIIGSEGRDFPLYRYAETNEHPINPDEWHDISFTVDGDRATALLDGKEIISCEGLDHLTPGRPAIAADNIRITLDHIDVSFLSGQGTLWRNVVHNKLPDEVYREGGTVLELKDKSLVYEHGSGVTFYSHDNGISWERADKPFTSCHGYPNILRLRNGDFIKIITRDENGVKYKASETSSDDGATWKPGGNICLTPYKGNTSAVAVNMNDKVTQISSGRIFYCQNYESMPRGTTVDGRTVFCEFYYSDDNGSTWTKAETDSWDLGGKGANDVQWFGECKILECDDGTLRMYNSWNDYGCIVYSESKDGGVTWGGLVKMPEFVCARSSMQFYRDQYADNETTYYMVWVYSPEIGTSHIMTRSRLSLARSYDGKNWEFLGDLWRWECRHLVDSFICHVVDAFIMTTEEYVICGAGYSEHLEVEGNKEGYHHAQRQHIYSIKKESLKAVPLTPVE